MKLGTKFNELESGQYINCRKALHIFFIATLFTALGFAISDRQAFAQNGMGGDAAAGEKLFKKCKACHKIGPEAKNSTGPVLNNVVGRAAGSYEGYRYGKGMKAANAKGLVWDEAQIFGYLKGPKKFLRAYLGDKKAKAKMRFKLKDETQRKDVIAFLVSISTASDGSMDEKPTAKDDASAIAATPAMAHMAGKSEICVQNNFDKSLLFTAESKDGTRELKTMGLGEVLCIPATGDSMGGTVGVFENEDALEGCSRLAKAGKTEVLMAYAAFDNCGWKQ